MHTVNICDAPYGAVGDGKTDSTLAISRALRALAPRGGTVIMPPGTYLMRGRVDVDDLRSLTIEGAGATLLLEHDPGQFLAALTLRGQFSVDGSRAIGGIFKPGHGCVIGDVMRYYCQRNAPLGGLEHGMRYYVTSVSGDSFTLAHAPGGAPLQITPAPGTHYFREAGQELRVRDLTFVHTRPAVKVGGGKAVLRVAGWRSPVVENVSILTADNMGLRVEDCANARILHNRIGSPDHVNARGWAVEGTGIWVVSPQPEGNIVLQGNIVSHTFDDGILAGHDNHYGDGGVVMQGNVVKYCGANALNSSLPNTVIVGNSVRWTCGPAVQIRTLQKGACYGFVISDNVLAHCGQLPTGAGARSPRGGIRLMIARRDANVQGGIIESNLIEDAKGNGIYVQDAQDVRIRGNSIVRPTIHGIYIRNGKRLLCEANCICQAGSHPIAARGTRNPAVEGLWIVRNHLRELQAPAIRLQEQPTRTPIKDAYVMHNDVFSSNGHPLYDRQAAGQNVPAQATFRDNYVDGSPVVGS